MGSYGQGPINLNYYLVKFGGHRHHGSEDIMILVCQVISEDHMIKGSSDFIKRRPSR